ncbi:hypothetical protein KI387_014710, partial [Taxus chinensis]
VLEDLGGGGAMGWILSYCICLRDPNPKIILDLYDPLTGVAGFFLFGVCWYGRVFFLGRREEAMHVEQQRWKHGECCDNMK